MFWVRGPPAKQQGRAITGAASPRAAGGLKRRSGEELQRREARQFETGHGKRVRPAEKTRRAGRGPSASARAKRAATASAGKRTSAFHWCVSSEAIPVIRARVERRESSVFMVIEWLPGRTPRGWKSCRRTAGHESICRLPPGTVGTAATARRPPNPDGFRMSKPKSRAVQGGKNRRDQSVRWPLEEPACRRRKNRLQASSYMHAAGSVGACLQAIAPSGRGHPSAVASCGGGRSLHNGRRRLSSPRPRWPRSA